MEKECGRVDGHLKGAGGEFDADGGFGFQAEFVPGESGEQIGFAYPGIAD